MSRLQITAVVYDDDDLALLGENVVSRTRTIASAIVDEDDLPRLKDRGLALLRVQPVTDPVEVDLSDLGLAQRGLESSPIIREPVEWPDIPLDVPEIGRLDEDPDSEVRIVAMDRPLGRRLRKKLTTKGWRPLERLGPMIATMRVKVDADEPDDVVGVTGQRRYAETDTINPDLIDAHRQPSAVIVEAFLHPWRARTPDKRADALVDWLSELGVTAMGHSPTKVRFPATRGEPLLWKVCALPEVRWVDEYVRPVLANDHARRLVGVDVAEGSSIPWTGAGQTVGMADSGIDVDHPDFTGRVGAVLPGVPNAQTIDSAGHGTHVAGSIAGAGSVVRGTAPECRLVVQSLLEADGSIDVPFDLGNLFDEAKRAGVHVHNNSWGVKARSVYRETSRELDTWTYANQDVLVVVAAGNDATAEANPRTSVGSVDLFSTNAPGTAKNALTVGACRTDREITPTQTWREYSALTTTPGAFADDPIGSEAVAGDPQQLAAFSGRGPCDDLDRLKPDVVAPGTYVLSARSSDAPDSAFWKLDDNPAYAYLGGSSMATGLVSGLAAVVRQYYVEERDHTPSAALLKATLVNGARWLDGADAIADHPLAPNFHQGFGCVDLAGSVPLPDHSASPGALVFADVWGDDEGRFTHYGQTRDYAFKADAGPLRICLVWPDPPGVNVQCPISLMVQHAGDRWAGNMDRPNNAYKVQLDTNNNVQIVRLEQAAQGTYQVRLTASADVDVANGPQSFALVCTGAIVSDLRRQ